MILLKRPLISCVVVLLTSLAQAQNPAAPQRPVFTPLPPELGGPSKESRETLRTPPAYPVPYEPASTEQIQEVMDRVLGYLEVATKPTVFDQDSRTVVTDLSALPKNPGLASRDFMLTSYEWGVTYAGMLAAAETTGNPGYRNYVSERLGLIGKLAAHLRNRGGSEPTPVFRMGTVSRVLKPRSLDDSGAMCAAVAKAVQAGIETDLLRPMADNYIAYISKDQYRFADGTLARHRPLENALWLDDLYMSVPALAQMGKLTGNRAYFDDAVRQILQFSERMFVPEKGLYMHGWIESMEHHPVFHWGRANGWAVMSMAELLSVLPEDHPGRTKIMAQYKAHVNGLLACQGGNGLWHQLLDRSDSYLESSASAMFVFAIARGINQGWLNPDTYTACVSLGWNAVAAKVNAKGQVEATCVGTGMGFDPAFYYHRPVNVFAAHGYGPVLLAGAEMITLRKNSARQANISDGALQNRPSPSRW